VGLAGQGFGPQVLSVFCNGRVEEFLYCKTLQPEEMCSLVYVPRIAQMLAKFHAVSAPLPREPNLWQTIWSWFALAQQLDFSVDPGKAAAYADLDFAAMESEIKQLQSLCDNLHSPVVFGHNDLLSGNIVVLQQKGFDPLNPDPNGALQFIDFEYSVYTYRGFDIGNHFNEYAGFDCQYSR